MSIVSINKKIKELREEDILTRGAIAQLNKQIAPLTEKIKEELPSIESIDRQLYTLTQAYIDNPTDETAQKLTDYLSETLSKLS